MADYVLIYDTSTGRLVAKLTETAHITDGAVTSAKLASGQVGSLHVAPAAIISSLIASGALGQDHILNGEIVSALIASGQVGSLHVAPAAIISSLIASGALGQDHILNGEIVSALIASGAVGQDHILDGQIVSALIASGQVGSLHVAPAAIVSALLASGHIGSFHIAANAIVSGLVASGGLPPLTSGQIWVGGAANNPGEAAQPSGVPSGGIIIWHGTIANIPAGYVICDGNNSTPNLLTKFIQGVATAATDPGATGGAATHALSEAELASHIHEVDPGFGVGGTPTLQQAVDTGSYVGPNTTSAGSGSAHENEPTFYDVAFIMKT